jgi:hypothetical protein
MSGPIYFEDFDDGPGGWVRVVDNVQPVAALPIHDSAVHCLGPWWVDYNHAPPGGGYLQLLLCLPTRGPFGEHLLEVGGVNRFVHGRFPLNFTDARFSVRLKGELEAAGASLCLLLQGAAEGLISGWVLVGQPLRLTREYDEQSLQLVPDERQWRCLGSRHDRRDMYGTLPLAQLLGQVNVNLYLVLFPVQPRPMGPLAGDPHLLRAGRDYPLWPSSIPQGYVTIDWIRIEFPVI